MSLVQNEILQLAEYESLFVGKKLGSGISRRVYVNKFDPTTVIKFEDAAGRFQNIREWHNWQEMRHTVNVKWFAPCISLSACGTMLIQKRADPLPKSYKLPLKMPAFICDCKRNNFGLINNKLVAVDYGYVVSDYDDKLKRVRWNESDSSY